MITGNLRRYAGVRARSRNPERRYREGSRLAGVRRLTFEPAAEVLSDHEVAKDLFFSIRQTLKEPESDVSRPNSIG